MSASTKLPRKPHADPPRPDELIRKRSGADLQNGWLGRHGTLYLSDDRLVFVPTIMDTAMFAKRREIILDELTEVERFPRDPADMARGGVRARLLLHTPECVYQFMVGDLDAWFGAIERVFELRRKKGREHTPKFTREGVKNMLLEDAE